MRPLRAGNFEVVISGDRVTVTQHSDPPSIPYTTALPSFDVEELNDLEYVVQQAAGWWRRMDQRRE